jgi:hypothetical protein
MLNFFQHLTKGIEERETKRGYTADKLHAQKVITIVTKVFHCIVPSVSFKLHFNIILCKNGLLSSVSPCVSHFPCFSKPLQAQMSLDMQTLNVMQRT